MNRIRYGRNGSTLVSKQNFRHPSNGAVYSVSIDIALNEVTIKDLAAGGAVVYTFASPTLAKAKVIAKATLVTLGIVTEKESRNTGTSESTEEVTPTAVL